MDNDLAVLREVLAEDYYRLVGCNLGRNKKGDIVWPETESIRLAWYRSLRESHPDNRPDVEFDLSEPRFRAVMEAGNCLLDPDRVEVYQHHLESNSHKVYIEGPRRVPFTDSLPDWLVIVVQDMVHDCQCVRGDYDTTLEACSGVATEDLPAYIPGERLRQVLPVHELIGEVLQEHDRFFHLRQFLDRSGGLTWTFRSKAWTSKGATAIADSRKISERERARMANSEAEQPVGEIVLALDFWLMAEPPERRQAIFHQLCHFQAAGDKLKVVPHDLETFVDELDRYGIQTQEQAEYIAAALRRPDTFARLEHFAVLPDNQLVLFKGYFAEAQELAG